MSEASLTENHKGATSQTGISQGRPVLAFGLATVLAVVVVAIGVRMQGQWPLTMIAILGLLAFLGLLSAFGTLAGFVHFGRLPKQRAFFDGLMDAVGDCCAVSDARGRVVFANEAYRALLGETRPGRLTGIENLYTGYPDVSERVYRLAQAARDGAALSEEFRLEAGSAAAGAHGDQPTWMRCSVSPVSTSVGQRFTLWRLQDITVDRAQQEGAFASLQFIINYLDHAPAGFFSTNKNGQIVYLNATLADWLEIDLLQTSDGSLKLDDLLDEDDVQMLLAIAPEPGGRRTEVFDLSMRSKSGQPVPVRIVHRTDFDHAGSEQPSRSLVLDMRGAGTGEDIANAADQQLNRLINAAPIGIAKISPDGEIETANSVFVGLCSDVKRGARLENAIRSEQRAEFSHWIGKALAGADCDDSINVTFTGSENVSGELILSRGGQGEANEDGLTVFAIDTTKHNSLEVQLAQSQKMQAVGQLAGGVAHDFNNVLTAIIGFSDLLLAKHRPTDPSFADIMNIKQNANRAANLVRQLLAFSRRQTLRPEVLSLTDVLSDLGNLLGRLLGEKIELKVVHGRGVGLVKVDVNQFEQVIINLAVNARDAMPEGGVLSVSTANVAPEQSRTVKPGLMPEGEYVLCEVRDTGTGMPQDVVDKIYEPFFSTKEVGKGTGLGLSTVYGIIKQTGGFIFCDSVLGQGTTFRIYLPRHAETAADGAEKTATQAPEEKRADLTGHGTILLVEDEDAVRSFASRALESRGYTVLEADSGERALEIVEEHDGGFDLVLSDVVMPEMDGPSLLKELRKRGISTKVVFISGYAEDAFEKNLEGQEDFAFLPKPFSLKQLAGAVKSAIEG